MKISKSRKKNPFNFDSVKNSFWVHKVSGIKILQYFQKFHKTLSSGFWKKAHFTSPPLWKFLSPNVTGKKTKIHLILIQSKIPFGCTKLVALRYYFQIFTKSYRVVLKKRSLYFTSRMKFFKYKCNSKTQKKKKNPFIFDSIQNSFWMHKVTCIRMIFTRFHKKIID